MTQYARTELKLYPMFEDEFAARVIEQMQAFYPTGDNAVNVAQLVEERCGRLVRGVHKGQLRGWAHVRLVTEGGWLTGGLSGGGRVVYPGQVLHIEIRDYSGKILFAV